MTHGGNVWEDGVPTKWLDFSANIRPEGAPRWVREALMGGMQDISYYPDMRMRRATEALAQHLGLSAETVRPTAGGISALDLAARLPASGALISTPCFGEYEELCLNRGLMVRKVSLLKGKCSLGGLAECVVPELFEGCAVWLCNPLNPIGVAFSKEQVKELLMAVENARGWLIVDEAFIGYCSDHSMASEVGKHERLLVTGSMTKLLGIPGVRLGYLCAHPRALAGLERYQHTWELNCFAEAVLCALPGHADEISKEARINATRRDGLRHGLEALNAFVYPSEAAFLLAKFPCLVESVAERLKSEGILVRQCMDFAGLDDGFHLRLAVKDEVSNARLLESLKKALHGK